MANNIQYGRNLNIFKKDQKDATSNKSSTEDFKLKEVALDYGIHHAIQHAARKPTARQTHETAARIKESPKPVDQKPTKGQQWAEKLLTLDTDKALEAVLKKIETHTKNNPKDTKLANLTLSQEELEIYSLYQLRNNVVSLFSCLLAQEYPRGFQKLLVLGYIMDHGTEAFLNSKKKDKTQRLNVEGFKAWLTTTSMEVDATKIKKKDIESISLTNGIIQMGDSEYRNEFELNDLHHDSSVPIVISTSNLATAQKKGSNAASPTKQYTLSTLRAAHGDSSDPVVRDQNKFPIRKERDQVPEEYTIRATGATTQFNQPEKPLTATTSVIKPESTNNNSKKPYKDEIHPAKLGNNFTDNKSSVLDSGSIVTTDQVHEPIKKSDVLPNQILLDTGSKTETSNITKPHKNDVQANFYNNFIEKNTSYSELDIKNNVAVNEVKFFHTKWTDPNVTKVSALSLNLLKFNKSSSITKIRETLKSMSEQLSQARQELIKYINTFGNKPIEIAKLSDYSNALQLDIQKAEKINQIFKKYKEDITLRQQQINEYDKLLTQDGITKIVKKPGSVTNSRPDIIPTSNRLKKDDSSKATGADVMQRDSDKTPPEAIEIINQNNPLPENRINNQAPSGNTEQHISTKAAVKEVDAGAIDKEMTISNKLRANTTMMPITDDSRPYKNGSTEEQSISEKISVHESYKEELEGQLEYAQTEIKTVDDLVNINNRCLAQESAPILEGLKARKSTIEEIKQQESKLIMAKNEDKAQIEDKSESLHKTLDEQNKLLATTLTNLTERIEQNIELKGRRAEAIKTLESFGIKADKDKSLSLVNPQSGLLREINTQVNNLNSDSERSDDFIKILDENTAKQLTLIQYQNELDSLVDLPKKNELKTDLPEDHINSLLKHQVDILHKAKKDIDPSKEKISNLTTILQTIVKLANELDELENKILPKKE